MKPDDKRLMRLKPEFTSAFDWKKVKRDRFCLWARQKLDPPRRIDPHHSRPMREGEPVPAEMITAFGDYLAKGGLDVKGQLPLASEQVEDVPPSSREPYVYRTSWLHVRSVVTEKLLVRDEAYCEDEADVESAARMIMLDFAFREGRPESPKAAMAFAERGMRRTLSDYCQMILNLWKANEHAAVFAAQVDRRGVVSRTGVSVVAPVKDAYYRRFLARKAEDMDIAPGDVAPRSRRLYIEALSDNPTPDARADKGPRSMTQIRSFMYQLAALCTPLSESNSGLWVFTQGGARRA